MGIERDEPSPLTVLLGPYGLWTAFKVCVALRLERVPYRLYRNPRCVAVPGRSLAKVVRILISIGVPPSKKSK